MFPKLMKLGVYTGGSRHSNRG